MASARAAPCTRLLQLDRHRAPTVLPATTLAVINVSCALLVPPQFLARPLALAAARLHTAMHPPLGCAPLAQLARCLTSSVADASHVVLAISSKMPYAKCALLELKLPLPARLLALLALIASTPPQPLLACALNALLVRSPTLPLLDATHARLEHISSIMSASSAHLEIPL